MKLLFLIPARGGSKGLPGKNIKPLCQKPLIYYTIDAAREVGSDENICVSTDDKKIAEVVKSYGLKVPFLRPNDIATDLATSQQVINHAIEQYQKQGLEYDYIVLLQPTSPLRTGEHIKEALELIREETELIVSVKLTDANPYYVLYEEDSEGFLRKSKDANYTRRQDCPQVYEVNGAIYIINIALFNQMGMTGLRREKYVMDKRSSVDIDDILDFKMAEFLMNS